MNHPHSTPQDTGWIEVITGCMFSGKTEELIRRVRRARYANQPIVAFKPGIDVRYSDDSLGSHAGGRLRSFQVAKSSDIPALVGDAVVVAIDEAQFLDAGIVDVCERLADDGKRVIVAGLDLDWQGKPFGPIPHLLAVAEYIQKTLAICVVCGNPADRSQRIVHGEGQVMVGAAEAYEARCRKHWDPHDFTPVQERLPFGRNLAEEAQEAGHGDLFRGGPEHG